MRTLKLLAASVTTAALVLGPSTTALAQEQAEEGPSPYLYGEVEGLLHHDMDNPLDCAVGFTSDSTLSGGSTLGPLTVRMVNCYVPTDTFDNTSDGTVTYTFESGDTIEGTATGNCLPDWTDEEGGVFTCIGVTTVSGGTGAYEGATGTIHAVGFVRNVHPKDPDALPGDAPYELIFEGLVES
ncbi:MAG: hypothetical protein PVG27_06120 [Chloroflexota bacterium]|jgi:hypothetical protein